MYQLWIIGVVASVLAVVCKQMRQLPPTRNNIQQGMQTDAKCNIQQCCLRLHRALYYLNWRPGKELILVFHARCNPVKEQIKKSIMSVMPQIALETFIDQKVNRKVTLDLIWQCRIYKNNHKIINSPLLINKYCLVEYNNNNQNTHFPFKINLSQIERSIMN